MILDDLNKCSEKERVLTILNAFDSEVMNGGLCQFFVNDSRYLAPFVSEALLAVGATEVNEKFVSFVEENKIDLNDLSSFDSRTLEQFSAQYTRYPFDDFDNFYYKVPKESAVIELVEKYMGK